MAGGGGRSTGGKTRPWEPHGRVVNALGSQVAVALVASRAEVGRRVKPHGGARGIGEEAWTGGKGIVYAECLQGSCTLHEGGSEVSQHGGN